MMPHILMVLISIIEAITGVHEAVPFRNTGRNIMQGPQLQVSHVLDTLFLFNNRLRTLTCSGEPSCACFQIQAGGFLPTSLANMRAQVIFSAERKPAHRMCGPKRVGFFDPFQICLGLSPGWSAEVRCQSFACSLTWTSNCSFANAIPPHSGGSSPIAQKSWKGVSFALARRFVPGGS